MAEGLSIPPAILAIVLTTILFETTVLVIVMTLSR